jgi:hypothetical protein
MTIGGFIGNLQEKNAKDHTYTNDVRELYYENKCLASFRNV